MDELADSIVNPKEKITKNIFLCLPEMENSGQMIMPMNAIVTGVKQTINKVEIVTII